jgi:hypothetical protein
MFIRNVSGYIKMFNHLEANYMALFLKPWEKCLYLFFQVDTYF